MTIKATQIVLTAIQLLIAAAGITFFIALFTRSLEIMVFSGLLFFIIFLITLVSNIAIIWSE